MTSTRYFIARIAQAFGYYQKSQRMGDAASEMHLLREAETMLGLSIWEKVENIEKKPIIGVDLGIKTLATLSDGKSFKHKRPYKKLKR